MGQAKLKGSFQERQRLAILRNKALAEEVEKLTEIEKEAAQKKEEMLKQLIAWHLKHPEYKTRTE